jgi:hypothetical protein
VSGLGCLAEASRMASTERGIVRIEWIMEENLKGMVVVVGWARGYKKKTAAVKSGASSNFLRTEHGRCT